MASRRAFIGKMREYTSGSFGGRSQAKTCKECGSTQFLVWRDGALIRDVSCAKCDLAADDLDLPADDTTQTPYRVDR